MGQRSNIPYGRVQVIPIDNLRLKVGVRPRWWVCESNLFEFEKGRAIPTAFLALPTINCGDFLATYKWRERVSRWLQIMRWILFVICYIGCFCTVFVSLPRIRYLEYFITSSSGEEDVTVDFGMFSKYTLRFVYEQWQHIQLAQT